MSDLPAGLLQATADGDLVFEFTGGRRLQLHASVICMWSKTVIKQAISSGCKRDSQDRLLLQLPEAEFVAWTHALPFMYPPIGIPPPCVTWDSAMPLWKLAHKYDMPGVTSYVLTFLKTASLNVATAWEWLELACQPQMELPDAALQRCIQTIVNSRDNWPSNTEDYIDPKVAAQLYNKLVSNYRNEVAALHAERRSAAAKAQEAAATAEQQHQKEVTDYKARIDDLLADLRWSAMRLRVISRAHLPNWEFNDIDERLGAICGRHGLDITGGDADLQGDGYGGLY